MSRKHALLFALLLASSAVLGAVALTRTLHLGQASSKASDAVIAKRTAQLDRFEASLAARLARKPPPLPKVPSTASYAASAVAPAQAAGAAPQVRYVRPAPIVVHKKRPGGETEASDSAEGGGDD